MILASAETVRTITIKGRTEGISQASADLKQLADAHDAVATVQDKTSRSTLSVQNALDRQQRSLDSGYRSNLAFAQAERDLGRARDQGLISIDRYNQLIGAAEEKYGKTTGATRAFQTALGGLNGQIIALSAGAGPLGATLAAFGPWGFAAAVGIGAVSAAWNSLVESAQRVGEKSREIKIFSETTGLAINQISALKRAGAEFGLDSDQARAALERMTVGIEEARRGSGKLYDELLRINPTLADQLARTRTSAQGWDVLSQAWKSATLAQQNLFARNVFGRGNIAAGQLLGATANAGGLDEMTSGMKGFAAASDEVIKKQAELQLKIEETNKHARSLMDNLFAQSTLEKMLIAAQTFERMAKSAKEMKEMSWGEWFKDYMIKVGQVGGDEQMVGARPQPGQTGTMAENLAAGKETLKGAFSGNTKFWADQTKSLREINEEALKAAESYDTLSVSAEYAYNRFKPVVAALGAAATPAEQFKLKQLELAAAMEKEGISSTVAARALAALKLSQDQAALSARERLGIASETEIRTLQMRQLDDDTAKGFIKNAQERATAEGVYKKQLEETVRQIEVTKAALPGLKQLELESGGLRSQLDTLSTSSLNNLTTALADIGTRSKTAAEAFSNLGLQVVRSLEEMLIKMVIVAPIAKSLQSALGGFLPGGGVNPNFVGPPMAAVGHTGGIIGSGELGGRYVHPAYFEYAPRFGSGGIVGGERAIVAHDGEGIFTKQQMAAMGGSHVQVNVINNASGTAVQTRERSEGGVDIRDVIISTVNDGMASGKFDGVQRQRFGNPLRPRPR